MSNLHRDLAPISAAAWANLEAEAARTFKRNIGGRRVVDVHGPHGPAFAAVGTGRLAPVDLPDHKGVSAHLYTAHAVARLRVPFTLSREEIDGVERGSQDPDWDPVKAAAKQMAFAEDRILFDGWADAGIQGIREQAPEQIVLPKEATDVPEAVAQALSRLRLAGVEGPYVAVLGAELWTLVSETSDHGYPIREHVNRLVDEVVWAPAITGAAVLSTRGGDYDLELGQDLSIGYLSHDADTVELYFQESLTFLANTPEAAVSLPAQA